MDGTDVTYVKMLGSHGSKFGKEQLRRLDVFIVSRKEMLVDIMEDNSFHWGEGLIDKGNFDRI